jgi:dephospho-CoA kinase
MSKKMRPLIVGLTGGIASGKSMVAKDFKALGARLIDADRISREVVRPGSKAWKKIVKTFGKEVLTSAGGIDRKKLGAVVFASPARLKKLERITHPEILAQIRRDVNAARGEKLVIIDLPLLFEAQLERMVDRTIVVWAPESVQAKRLAERSGLSRAEIKKRLAAQMPIDRKKQLADIVIDNSGTRGKTRREVKKIWGVLTKAVQ